MKSGAGVFLWVCIMAAGWFFICSAQAEGPQGQYHISRNIRIDPQERAQCRDRGNKTAGLTTAWLLLLANAPIVFGMCVRWARRSDALGSDTKTMLAGMERFQKKRLMGLHAYGNLAAGTAALFHFFTSCCRSTPLPEWGLLLLLAMAALGVVLKWKLSTGPGYQIARRIHTHPAVLAALILLLVIGHDVMR